MSSDNYTTEAATVAGASVTSGTLEDSGSQMADTLWPDTGVYNVSVASEEGPSETTLFAAAIYLTCAGTVACIGNITVLTVILRDKKLRSKPHNHLIITLAGFDLSMAVGGYPFTVISAYSGAWIFDDWACTFVGFFVYFVAVVAEDLLVAICIFRYIMICKPGKSYLLTPRVTFWSIMACIIYSLFWTGTPLIGWGAYAPEPWKVSCSLDWAKHEFSDTTYMVACIFFCYFLHIGIMGYCYRHISRQVAKLADRDRQRGRIVLEDEMVYRSKVADDAQVTRMCFFIVIVFSVIWAPYAFVCAVHIFYPHMPLYITTLPTLGAKSFCMMNPMVYFATNPTFRKKAKELFGCAKKDSAVAPEVPPSQRAEDSNVIRKFDRLSKDGVYLGQEEKTMAVTRSMF